MDGYENEVPDGIYNPVVTSDDDGGESQED
jgi:hypothetical protein